MNRKELFFLIFAVIASKINAKKFSMLTNSINNITNNKESAGDDEYSPIAIHNLCSATSDMPNARQKCNNYADCLAIGREFCDANSTCYGISWYEGDRDKELKSCDSRDFANDVGPGWHTIMKIVYPDEYQGEKENTMRTNFTDMNEVNRSGCNTYETCLAVGRTFCDNDAECIGIAYHTKTTDTPLKKCNSYEADPINDWKTIWKIGCDEMNGWLEFENYCYKAVEPEYGPTWHEANDICKELDANLASIHSDEENNFILSITSGFHFGVWIGLHWDDNEFKYTDGSAYDYSNWYPGEPDENACVGFRHSDGLWNGFQDDADCNFWEADYVCKKPKH